MDLIDAIIEQESGGDPNAVSPMGAIGLMQLMIPVLQDYNFYNKQNYGVKDLYNPDVNKQIGSWYFNERIPKMLKHYKISDTMENRLWSYNAGVKNVIKGRKPAETVNYIKNIMGKL